MGGDGSFYAPMGYSTVWLVLGVVILLAVVGWYVVVWWQTRPAPPAPALAPPPAGWRLARLKDDCRAHIDDVVRRVDGGDLSQRGGHQELSTVVRRFVEDASGVPAPTMTLTDLGRSDNARLGPVTDVVLLLYPAEFGPDRTSSVAEVAQVARRVVDRWT